MRFLDSEEKRKNRNEKIDIAAYFLSQKGYTYDDLCWMLAEKIMFPDDPSIDALKFWQAFVREMIDTFGANTVKAIAIKLGSKLGQIYKKKGIKTVDDTLKTSYGVMKAASVIEYNQDNITVEIEYTKNFCPIGGRNDPKKAELFQKNVCLPFTIGLLNEIDPKCKYEGQINECIMSSNRNCCRYSLHIEKKE